MAAREPSAARRAVASAGAFPFLALAVLLVAEAGSVLVQPNGGLDSLYAERVTLTLKFQVQETRLARAHVGLPVIDLGGRHGSLEITEAMTPGATSVGPGNWTYEVVVAEREPGSVAAGEYAVDLARDGRHVATVVIAQRVANEHAVEGARILFDIGAERPEAPLFVVAVRSLTPSASAYRLRSVVDADLSPKWRGVGGNIEGVINPPLDARVGEETQLTIVNGDNGFHRIRVTTAGGTLVAGPSADIASLNEEAELRWTPAATGDFRYECDYHADTMRGTITVT